MTPTETEADFQSWVVDAAKLTGWRVHIERPARTDKGWRTPIEGDAGWPDVLLLRPPRCIIAELKSDSRNAKPSADQEAWLLLLAQVPNLESYLWRPAMREEILRILAR